MHDAPEHEGHADGSLTHSNVDNRLAQDTVHGLWNTPINIAGWAMEARTMGERSLPFDSLETRGDF